MSAEREDLVGIKDTLGISTNGTGAGETPAVPVIRVSSLRLWVAAERLPQLNAVYPLAILQPKIAAPESFARTNWTFEEALVEIVRGRLEGLGPVTVENLVSSFGLSKLEIEAALLKLEAEGFVIRGMFTPGASET